MALCGPGACDCAFISESLNIVRDGNIITIEQAEFSSITELQEAVANIQAQLALDPATYVNTAGDSMTGALAISSTGQQLKLTRTDTPNPHIGFYHSDGVSRQGYIQYVDGVGLLFTSETDPTMRFAVNATEVMRYATNVFLIGKAATNLGVAGVELLDSGRIYSVTANTNTLNLVTNIILGDNGDVHHSIRRSNTQIGSISQATTSTVAFNTSSDEDLKTNIMPVDDELAEWVARIVEPYMFEFKIAPGDVHLGYVAQRVAAVWPQAIELGIVTPGFGNIEDRTWDDDGNETTPEGAWRQWSMDYGKMTGIIHAAWQSTARKLDALTERVAALEAA